MAAVRIPTIRFFISSGCIILPREWRDLRAERERELQRDKLLSAHADTIRINELSAAATKFPLRDATLLPTGRSTRSVHQRTSSEISNLSSPLSLFSPEATLAE